MTTINPGDPPADPVAAYLAEVRERVAPGPDGKVGPSWWIAQNQVYSEDIPRLLAAVEAALAQHQPTRSNEDGKFICDKCSFAYRTTWPCGEYEAISRALLGEGETGA